MESSEAKIFSFPLFKKKVKSEASKKRARRINSFVTDILFIQIFQKLSIFAYIEFINQSFFTLPLEVKSNLLANLSQMRGSTMFFSYFSYFLVTSYLFEGKTIGKSLFSLRVVSRLGEGNQLSFRDSLLRAVGYTISYIMLFLPFLASALSKDGKGLPDYLSQTEVMTDEQHSQYLYDRDSSESNSDNSEDTQEKAVSSTHEGPTEQLDLFVA